MGEVIFVFLNAYFRRSACLYTHWSSARHLWQSSFHQCATECIFNFENDPDCGYSLNIRSRLMSLISMFKSFWSWHKTLVGQIKLWMTPLFTLCGWLDLEVQKTTCMSRFLVHFCEQFSTPLHDQDIKISKNRGLSLPSTSIVNLMVGLMLLRWWRNRCNLPGPYDQTTKVLLTYLNHLAGLLSAISNAISLSVP
jgi:hypothetical protein